MKERKVFMGREALRRKLKADSKDSGNPIAVPEKDNTRLIEPPVEYSVYGVSLTNSERKDLERKNFESAQRLADYLLKSYNS